MPDIPLNKQELNREKDKNLLEEGPIEKERILEGEKKIEEAEPISEIPEKKETELSRPPVLPLPQKPAPFLEEKSETLKEIEGILEEDLEEIYFSQSPPWQLTFKNKGEAVALKIENLLSKAVIKAKKILKLIKDWLKMIPKVNKFFLEQEAKIKTDKIMGLRR